MEKDFQIGQTLVVELDGECFVGEFHFINKDRTRIELVNVFDFNTGEKLAGSQIYYKSDIKCIKPIKNDTDDRTSPLADTQTLDAGDQSNEIRLTTSELQEIDTLSRNAVYIIKTDRYYHDSIKNMKRQHDIVVNLESCNVGRSTRTTVLTICTRQIVYIFDVISLGGIFPELREVLEAVKPKKIIHDSRKITDNLKYRQKVELNGIFDTYAAHGIHGDTRIWQLEDCLKEYLNMPENFSFDDKNVNWEKRPLDDNSRIITAKKALFTYKLYDCLLHDHMLKKFYDSCKLFANVYSSNTDSVEVASEIASNKNSSINDIEEIDLPMSVVFEDCP